ncbi:MAG: translocation/assembly module TamB domain-containing protein, partial [Endomicrobiia bacterium]
PTKEGKSISEEKIDISFQLEKGDLSILETAFDDIKSAEGKIESRLRISGKLSQPQLGGYFIVTDGEINSKKHFNTLRKLNIGIIFSDNKLEIKEFSGRIGDGKFEITGYLVFGEMFEIEEYNLSLETPEKKGLKIFIPELPIPIGQFFKTTKLEELIRNYSFGEPHASLKLVGKKDNVLFKGYIKLDNTHFSYPPPKGSSKGKLLLGPLAKANWDIEIRAGENTWYESELMSANITGSLRITGPYSDLTTNGKIESTKGSINYINKIYEIKHLIFEVIDDECFLQGRAETSAVFSSRELPTPGTQIGTITTTKKIGKVEMNIPRAPLGEIVPQFSSKEYPDMESEKLLQATYGITEDMNARERDILFRKQLIQLIDSSLASPLARNLLRKSGIVDSLRVSYSPFFEKDTVQTDTTGSPTVLEMFSGTRYMVEKYLTGDLLLGYAITLGELQKKLDLRHEFELQYRWKGNIFIRGIYGYEPRKTPEREDWQIRVEPQWRFGWPDENKK